MPLIDLFYDLRMINRFTKYYYLLFDEEKKTFLGYRPDRPSSEDSHYFNQIHERPGYGGHDNGYGSQDNGYGGHDNGYGHHFNEEPSYGQSPIHNEIDETNSYNNPSRTYL